MDTWHCWGHTLQPTKKDIQDRRMRRKDDFAGYFRTRPSHPMREALKLHLSASKLAIKEEDKQRQVGRRVFLDGPGRMDGIAVHGVRGQPDYSTPGIHPLHQATAPPTVLHYRAAITPPHVHDIDPRPGFLERWLLCTAVCTWEVTPGNNPPK